MKAWRVHETGPYREALQWEECDQPDPPGPMTSVIKVHAAGLNFPDILFIGGEYQMKPPLPFSPGLEAVGTVVAARDSKFKVGDRIVTTGLGAFAEYMIAADPMNSRCPTT